MSKQLSILILSEAEKYQNEQIRIDHFQVPVGQVPDNTLEYPVFGQVVAIDKQV